MGFPLRLPFTIGTIALWNGLLLLDRPWDLGPGPATIAAVALLFASSVLIRTSESFQRFALKSPEALPVIRPVLNIVSPISGLMLLILGVMMLLKLAPQ